MATNDRSRAAHDPAKRYTGVGWQQGRIPTDDDLNDAQSILAEERRRERVDVIGPTGSPDDGFRVANARVVGGRVDFDIGAGTLYVGGLRLERVEPESFRRQTDWLRNPGVPVPDAPRVDLVYVEAWEQVVSAVEDEELYEVGLGGPDTTTRIRTMARVRVVPGVEHGECQDAWAATVARWGAEKLGSLGPDHRLIPDARLTVGFEPGGDPDDLCTPSAAGGYLGAENQAIRVRLHDSGHFTWGFNNGAPLYRVRLAADRKRVILDTEPRDEAHWPLAGQVVELIPWAAVLPNGEKLAEELEPGHLARVAGSYDPDGPDGPEITLADPVPAGFGEEWSGWGHDPNELLRTRHGMEAPQQPYFFLRVWDRGADTTSPLAIPIGADVPLGTTGLRVTFEGTDFRPGDYWILAARPRTPDRVTPWELMVGRPPHGFHRYVAPLAILSWRLDAANGWVADVHDCRPRFAPLTRLRGCCTVTVGDGHASHGDYDSIQAAIDALPPSGGEVCVRPGRYRGPVRIVGRHGITIRGCGWHTHLGPVDGERAGDPVIEVRDSTHIRIASLRVEAGPDSVGVLLAETGWDPDTGEEPGDARLERVELRDLRISASTASAIEVRGGRRIRIHGCRVRMSDSAGPWPAVTVAGEEIDVVENEITVRRSDGGRARNAPGGLWIRGASERVRVLRNLIRNGIGHGITLGDVLEIHPDGAVGAAAGWVYFDASDPCNPCAPGTVIIVTTPPDGSQGPRRVPGHPLRDVRIVGNRILEMGLSGVSVLGFFDDGSEGQIAVIGLTLERNEIRECLRRELDRSPDAVADRVAYGGIVLADVEDLVVRDNRIEGNGANPVDPVCGIFALSAEAVEISRNRIVHNGARPPEGPASARPGVRGGIVLRNVLAPVLDAAGVRATGARALRGEAAATVHGNTVIAPFGQALAIRATGPVSIQDNRLTSLEIDMRGSALLASTVLVLNLGLPIELLALGGDLGGFAAYAAFGAAPAATIASPAPETIALYRAHLPGGATLVHGNQIALDALGAGVELALSSVAAITLDDLSFTDNQSECALLAEVVLIDTVAIAGVTARVADNRFQETLLRSYFSLLSAAALVNTTTGNQGTHCFWVLAGAAGRRISRDNVSLVDVLAPNALPCSNFNG